MSVDRFELVLKSLRRLGKLGSKTLITLHYPGAFRSNYQPVGREQIKQTVTLSSPGTSAPIKWSLKGVPEPFVTNTYFRPLYKYLQSALNQGFSIECCSAWDLGGKRHELDDSHDIRVVDLLLKKGRTVACTGVRESGGIEVENPSRVPGDA